MMYIDIDHDMKEADSKRNAAIVIQSTWRGFLVRGRTKAMLTGFIKLQKLYRQKLQVRRKTLTLKC